MHNHRFFFILLLLITLLNEFSMPLTAAEPENLHAAAAVLMDAESGRVLFEKNGTEKLPMASTTKIMTLLIALENADPDGIVTVSSRAASMPEVKLHIREGERYRLLDLLYSLILESHNDTAVAIAEHIGGSVEQFASMMNQKAQELGCTGTSFTCVHGLYDYGNVSSAHDLALIAKACAENETYMQVANTLSYTLPATNLHQNERTITSTNLMLNPEYPYYRDYIRGMKTGFTTLAGRCYVTFAQKDGHTYGLVVLGSDLDNIYREASEILDWAFASFSDRELVDTETPLTTAPLKKCRSYEEVELYAAAPVSGYGHADDKVTFTYDLQENISATVKDGAVLGTATVYLDGYEVGTVDLVTHQEYVSDFRTDLQSTLLLMAALIVLLAVLSFFTLVAGGGSLNLGRRRKARRR